jgi:hypothetical protein
MGLPMLHTMSILRSKVSYRTPTLPLPPRTLPFPIDIRQLLLYLLFIWRGRNGLEVGKSITKAI